MVENYRLEKWAEGYFGINKEGEVFVRGISKPKNAISLNSIIKKAQEFGLQLPILLRFTDILKDRLNVLCKAFQKAAIDYYYDGKIQIIYPVKVNQHKNVVETILNHQNGCSFGLEVGSKAEMMMVLGSLKHQKFTPVICNGYKDRSMIRLGVIGQKCGYSFTFVIEKPSELPLILEEARKEKLNNLSLGVRVRLCTTGKGNWQNTGGEKSKFGLSAANILQLVAHLKAEKALDNLKLLHFHLGSQISDLEDLKRGILECAQFYVQLKQLGVPIDTIDVGGGLAVDYEGMSSTSYFSMNYTVQDYAASVVSGFLDVCRKANLPHPNIITESGRAITAHHAVLITNVVNRECNLAHEKVTEKWVCNFSLFQSIPDVWGIDQIFPIMPLCGLNKPKTTSIVIQDITCDSDGRIDYYVNGGGERSTLLVPHYETSLPLIGIFLVGAYQEILGDKHNLFGNIDSVSIEEDKEGHFQLKNPIRGDTIKDVLADVHFDYKEIQDNYRSEIDKSPITSIEKERFKKEFEEILSQGTYLY